MIPKQLPAHFVKGQCVSVRQASRLLSKLVIAPPRKSQATTVGSSFGNQPLDLSEGAKKCRFRWWKRNRPWMCPFDGVFVAAMILFVVATTMLTASSCNSLPTRNPLSLHARDLKRRHSSWKPTMTMATPARATTNPQAQAQAGFERIPPCFFVHLIWCWLLVSCFWRCGHQQQVGGDSHHVALLTSTWCEELFWAFSFNPTNQSKMM